MDKWYVIVYSFSLLYSMPWYNYYKLFIFSPVDRKLFPSSQPQSCCEHSWRDFFALLPILLFFFVTSYQNVWIIYSGGLFLNPMHYSARTGRPIFFLKLCICMHPCPQSLEQKLRYWTMSFKATKRL